MDLEKRFKEETGFDAYIDNNLEPKIALGYYVEWLEEQLLIQRVSQQRELLAISCLKNITNPINYLKEEAKKDGCTLDGAMAIQVTRSGMFYQELAKKALKEIDNCG